MSTTLKKYRQQGTQGLQRRKPPGSYAKPTAEQLQELVEELRKGALHHGFTGEIWTLQRVGKLIEQLFGISHKQTQVGRILHKLSWSPQKPIRKARQQNAQQVKTWQEERLPELKKRNRNSR
ncbi:winged helix-turn-helix domain-containing protein [Nibrella saemangeumensis]|uniref:winged helix-turn-helix domain-containing protein n=1 Tax=Nibrella saemangeumensis TaxID=1084526 RepID=UPI0031E570EB